MKVALGYNCTVDIAYTIDMVYTIHMVYTVRMEYAVDVVFTFTCGHGGWGGEGAEGAEGAAIYLFVIRLEHHGNRL